jgi:hypothetical protein
VQLKHAPEEIPMNIKTNSAVAPAQPPTFPPGHVGPMALPGTGRMVWWTGRVAIGLRHQPERRCEPVSRSALWIQELMLGV